MQLMLTDELGNIHSVDVDPEMEAIRLPNTLVDKPESLD
jgi:hypothetical protein